MTTEPSPPTDESVRLTWSFPAAVGRVFAAWSDADRYRRWSWGSLGSETEAVVDCRRGGTYRVTTQRPDGGTWAFHGEYTDVVPDRRIVYTVHWTAPMGYDSDRETVEVVFEATEDGTRIEFIHRGVPPIPEALATHRKGWEDTLKTLERLLEEGM